MRLAFSWKKAPSKRWLEREREIRTEEQQHAELQIMKAVSKACIQTTKAVSAETETRVRRETRQKMQETLISLPEFVATTLGEWYTREASVLQNAATTWFTERLTPYKLILSQTVKDRVVEILAQDPIQEFEQAAVRYRRELVESASLRATNAFRTELEKVVTHLEATAAKVTERSAGAIDEDPVALPSGTRYALRYPGGVRVYVIEQSPGIRTVNVDGISYALALPFVIFVVCVTEQNQVAGMRIFFKNNRLGSLSERMRLPAFPNLNTDETVCLSFPHVGKDAADAVEAAIVRYWGSTFLQNHDRGSLSINRQRNPSIHSFTAWQEETKRDPGFVLGLSWYESEFATLGKSIQELMRLLGKKVAPRHTHAEIRPFLQEASDAACRAALETYAEMTPLLKLEEEGRSMLTERIHSLWKEGEAELTEMVTKAASEIFRRPPELPSLTEKAKTLSVRIDKEIKTSMYRAGFSIPGMITEEIR